MNGRLDRLRACLRENRLEAIMVTDPLNERYLSDFKFEDGYLLITVKNAYLVTDFRYYEEAMRLADDAFEIVMPKDRAAFVHGVFAADGVKTVGYEEVSLTCAEFARMTETYPEVTFSPAGDLFAQMRLIKDEEEIRRMTALYGRNVNMR